jgi:hypothetical protein
MALRYWPVASAHFFIWWEGNESPVIKYLFGGRGMNPLSSNNYLGLSVKSFSQLLIKRGFLWSRFVIRLTLDWR